jgi:hypothetical protein
MTSYKVTRLLQNPLGHQAPAGQRGDIVRVSNGWATIYLDPDDFDRATEGRIVRMLAEADTRPRAVIDASTPAGGRTGAIHQATVTALPSDPPLIGGHRESTVCRAPVNVGISDRR